MNIGWMKKIGMVIGAITLLSACTSVRPQRDAHDANDQVGFEMNGRFGVKYIEDGKDKSSTGKIEWQETRKATDIILATPIGNAVASLHITPLETVLKTSDGQMYVEKTPEELLYRVMGYELPISMIKEILGRAGKPAPDALSDPYWHLTVESRFANGLPKKILANRVKPSPLTMTVLIDQRSDVPE